MVIAALVAAVMIVPRILGNSQEDLGDGTTTATSSTPSAMRMAVAAGCSTADRIGVDCRGTHRYEVLPAGGDCTLRVAVTYLGGRWLVDVPMGVRVVDWAGGRCALDAGRNVHGSARDVLHEPGADWRRCADGRRKIVVRCSIPHTGEYVGTGSTGPATQKQCADAVRKYINKAPAGYLDKLEIKPLDVLCLVSARGDHLLTTTVRNLGVWPVPVTV